MNNLNDEQPDASPSNVHPAQPKIRLRLPHLMPMLILLIVGFMRLSTQETLASYFHCCTARGWMTAAYCWKCVRLDTDYTCGGAGSSAGSGPNGSQLAGGSPNQNIPYIGQGQIPYKGANNADPETGDGKGFSQGGPGNGGRPCGSCGASGGGSLAQAVGMPEWSVSEPMLNISLHDVPLTYQPSRGEAMSMELNFKHEMADGEAFESETAIVGIFGIGSHWLMPWRSYLRSVDGGGTGTNEFEFYNGLGGSMTLTNAGSPSSKDHLTCTFVSNTVPVINYPNGAQELFGLKFNADDGMDRYLKTRQIDAAGIATIFNYYTNSTGYYTFICLSNIVDGDGLKTTFTYTNINDFQLVSSVTDPFGHTVQLAYSTDDPPQLIRITDVLGIVSTIDYNPTDLSIATLTTPYTSTEFAGYLDAGGDSNKAVWVQENGIHSGVRNHIYLYTDVGDTNKITSTLASYCPATTNTLGGYSFPNTFDRTNSHLRNTFYWNPVQFSLLPADFISSMVVPPSLGLDITSLASTNYLQARMSHWLLATNVGGGGIAVSGSISLQRAPSPDGTTPGQITWYDYDSKFNGDAQFEGTNSLPRFIARTLPNGEPWFEYFTYNPLGYTTLRVATYGDSTSSYANLRVRTNSFTYAPNNIDLIMVTNAIGARTISNMFNAYHKLSTNYNTWGERTVYLYDTNQRLVSIVKPTGLVTTNIYGSDGFVSSSAAIGYRTNAYTWTNGLVYTHLDERGLLTTNLWDAIGRPLRISFPDGTYISNSYDKLVLAATVNRLGGTNKFLYNDFRQLILEVNVLNRTNSYSYCDCGSLSSKMDALGHSTSYSYDLASRLVTIQYPDSSAETNVFDSLGRIVTHFNSFGTATTNVFNNQNFIVAVSNNLGQVRAAQYDALDRITNGIDANGITIGFAYDSLNRRTSQTFPDGGVEYFGYTTNYQQVTAFTNPLGKVQLCAYDGLNRRTNQIIVGIRTNLFEYSFGGEMLGLTDGKGLKTSWSFDAYGRLTNKVDASSTKVLAFFYDAEGRMTNRWSAAKGAISYGYDAVGALTNIFYPSGPTVAFGYNANGYLTSMTDSIGTTQYSYDEMNRILAEDGPWANDSVTSAYSNGLRVGFNIENPAGSAWKQSYQYDKGKRLTNLVSGAGSFNYLYDTSRPRNVSRLLLPNGAYVTNAYESMARVTAATLKSSANSTLGGYTYGYNLAGFPTNAIRSDGSYSLYTFDDDFEIVASKGFESGGSPTRLNEQIGYSYDAAGNLTARTNNALIIGFTVNALNEVSAVTHSGSLTVFGTTTTNASSVTVNGTAANRYGDATFALGGFTVTNGVNSFTAIAQDSLSRKDTNVVVVNVPSSVSLSYDADGNLLGDGVRVFDYDDADRLVRANRGTLGKSEFTYNGWGQRKIQRDYQWIPITSAAIPLVTNVSLSSTVRSNFSGWVGYRILVGGSPIVVTELARWVRSGNTGIHTVKLVRSDGNDVPGGFVNINTSGGTAGQFAYAALGTGIVLEANNAYFVVSQEVSGGDSWYDLDCTLTPTGGASLTAQVSANNGTTVFSVNTSTNKGYGPVNLKFSVGLWSLAGENRFLYDDQVVVQERNGDNVPTATYTCGVGFKDSLSSAVGMGSLLSRTDNLRASIGQVNADSFYFADGNGNVAMLVNNSQAVVARYLYDPFGNILAKSGPLADLNRYRFSSKEYDDNMALYYYGFRFYDPQFQRWLTRDPQGEFPDGPNLYAFVGNSPLSRVDLDGLSWVSNVHFVLDFFFGTGDDWRVYGDDSMQTEEMKESPGAQALRNEFKKTKCVGFQRYAYDTGTAAYDTIVNSATRDLSSTAFQVGGFIGDAEVNDDGTVTYTIENEAGAKSFFYHMLPDRRGWRGPFRTIHQRFSWKEPLP